MFVLQPILLVDKGRIMHLRSDLCGCVLDLCGCVLVRINRFYSSRQITRGFMQCLLKQIVHVHTNSHHSMRDFIAALYQ